MRSFSSLMGASVLALFLSGCTTPYGEPNNTGTGALIGGASGAGLGAVLAHENPLAGAVFGGALGAITGGIIGNSIDQQQRPPVYVAGPPPPPAPGYVWVNGQWLWTGTGWVWQEGHWELMP